MSQTPPVELDILAYNLLAPIFVRVAGQSYSDFAHAAEADLDWSTREPRILQRIEAARADIVCLQEVQFEPGDEAKGELPWVPPARLRALAERGGYRLFPAPLSASQWRSQERRNLRATGRSACVGLVSLLGPRVEAVGEVVSAAKALIVSGSVEGVPFVCINVHLEGHPDKDAERAKQLKGALRKATKQGSRHLVVAGDFNADLDPASKLGQLVAQEPITSVPLGPTWCGQPEVPRAVDQILMSDGLAPVEHRVDLTPEDISRGMPNPDRPSDHAAISLRVRVVGPTPAAEPSSGPEPALSEARKLELARAWDTMQAEAPPRPNGPPSPEARAALEAFKARKKAFLDQLDNDGERSFVKKR